MCCFFNGFAGYRGFGMFNGFGGIFGIIVTLLGILFAVKLIKDMFFGNVGKKEETAKI
jgi:uncharacterized membrane protein